MKIAGLLIDVDGTLLISNDAHARAWVRTFDEFGYDMAFERVRPLIGMGGDKLLGALIPGISDEGGVGKAMSERRTEIFLRNEVAALRPAPGARALIERFLEDGLRLVVATSAKADELEALLRAADVLDLLPDRTTSDDIADSKPAPDTVHAGLAKLRLPEAAVLMLGDTPYDVEAAGNAGVGAIALRCGGWSDQDLQGAQAIYSDPCDLLAHYEQSPLWSLGS